MDASPIDAAKFGLRDPVHDFGESVAIVLADAVARYAESFGPVVQPRWRLAEERRGRLSVDKRFGTQCDAQWSRSFLCCARRVPGLCGGVRLWTLIMTAVLQIRACLRPAGTCVTGGFWRVWACRASLLSSAIEILCSRARSLPASDIGHFPSVRIICRYGMGREAAGRLHRALPC
jgi:hypothetical protein